MYNNNTINEFINENILGIKKKSLELRICKFMNTWCLVSFVIGHIILFNYTLWIKQQ